MVRASARHVEGREFESLIAHSTTERLFLKPTIYMIIRIFYIVGLLLLIPLIAMQLTNEVNWSFFDFIIMGGMLTITGLLIGITLKKFKTSKNRILLIAIIIIIFLLIWAELGVGIFGTRFAGN